MTRRSFLGGLAAFAVLPTLRECAVPDAQGISAYPFTLGVGSGDPLPDGVVLWTRLAPDPIGGGGLPNEPISVLWEVATDPDFDEVINRTGALARPDRGYAIHKDLRGLEPDRWYWYRFSVGDWVSPVGRTRTAPAVDCVPGQLRFGLATCQNYRHGYYTAHANLANEDLDLVFHVGDYIYESSGQGPVRPTPGVATTLEDYRARYALYRSDPDLQAAHAAFPWVVTWDDHEVEDNYAADLDKHGNDPATFLPRRAAAYRAWWENQATRLPPPTGPDLPIHRRLRWGRLADLWVLDTRQYRSNQPCGDGGAPLCDDNFDPELTMLGDAQEAWLTDGLLSSEARWNVLAQQVVFGDMQIGTAVNHDQWDGYPLARQRLLDLFASEDVANPVVLSGDLHAAFAADLHQQVQDPTTPVVATELLTPSISSNFNPDAAPLWENLMMQRPYVHHANGTNRGYVTCRLTPDALDARWRYVETVTEPTSAVFTGFELHRVAGPAAPAGGGAAC
ncbi:MAG: alkaline phosphatase D family protein [Acidimicrobiia bacterium]|nr:alkaline phosphatase D family protein [Acidimicrobiia bacterium]